MTTRWVGTPTQRVDQHPLENTDNCVAPMKGRGLRAELCRRQQVSELAMTTDDDRHPRDAGGGDRR